MKGSFGYKGFSTLCACLVALVLLNVTNAKGQAQQSGNAETAQKSTAASRVAAGQKMNIEGVIVKRDPDTISVRDIHGSDYVVKLTNSTEVKERKSNPFRRAQNYATTQLLRGLNVEVEGRGDSSGDLVASAIKIRTDDLRTANSVESRVTPVETRLADSETRLGQSEQNAQRLSGQVQELEGISNAARGGAKAAQETADAATAAANSAAATANSAKEGVNAANERISSLDNFEVKGSTMVRFKAGSSTLTKDAKAELDKLAADVEHDKGFLIEVSGFASSDGSEDVNRRLSQHRADAVIRYLAENYSIPLRRFVTPFGYGEKQPIADNKTHEGRTENRRVEVKILVNKGLAAAGPTSG
jgi:OmpA-OmpF porin, OOP family